MLALSLGLLFVMIVIAGLLADMERKRKIIVDLLDQLTPMLDRSRRLTLSQMRTTPGARRFSPAHDWPTSSSESRHLPHGLVPTRYRPLPKPS